MDILPNNQRHANSSNNSSSNTSNTSSSSPSGNGLTLLQSPSSLSASATSNTTTTTSATTPAQQNPSDRDQQVEKLLKEVKHLKQKVDILDKENTALKKSIYDLSARYAASISQGGLIYRPGPFVIENDAVSNAKSVIGTKAQEVISKAVQEAGGDVNAFQSGEVPLFRCPLLLCLTIPCFALGFSHDGKAFEIRYELKVGFACELYMQLVVGDNS